VLSRAHYLLGYAKRFKVSQEFILAAVACRVKIHVGKRPTVRVLDTKAAWNFNHLPRQWEGTNGAHRSKAICAPCICHPIFNEHADENGAVAAGQPAAIWLGFRGALWSMKRPGDGRERVPGETVGCMSKSPPGRFRHVI
jgi:hypothetical protein